MNTLSSFSPTEKKELFCENKELCYLDLSFNQIRSLDNFPACNLGKLRELYLIRNKIKVIEGLIGLEDKLELLELGDNRIRIIKDVSHLGRLKSLWLGRNKIMKMEGFEGLRELKVLSLQSNRIIKIEGLERLENLEELYLSHNGIVKIEGLCSLGNLKILDLGKNRIERLEGLEGVKELEELWINDNLLESFEELGKCFKGMNKFKTIYLEGNPLAKGDDYQKRALQVLPEGLIQLDAPLVESIKSKLEQGATGRVL